MTLDEVGTMSGEDMVIRYGAGALQQLIDLAVGAVKKGDDDEVKAIDGRMQEVERYLERNWSLRTASRGVRTR